MRGYEMMAGAMVCGTLVLGGCCTKKMSSDVAARDSVHRERREVAADSLCLKAERDRVMESAAEVEIVIEEELWTDPSWGNPKRDSLTGAPEEKCPLRAWRRTTIRAKQDVKETEKDVVEASAVCVTETEEQTDSVTETEEHKKEEKEGIGQSMLRNLVWVLVWVVAWVFGFTVLRVWRDK